MFDCTESKTDHPTTTVDALLCDARLREQGGKFFEAEALYRRALEQVPDSGEIHFLLG